MHYSTLLLGTLATGSAAVAHNGRHASFHARRQAESKRDINNVDWPRAAADIANVDWKTVDYSGVDWNTVNYGGQAASTPTPSAAEVQVAAVATSAAAKASSVAVQVSSAASQVASSPAATSTQSSSSGSAGDFLSGVTDFFKNIGVDIANANKDSGADIYIGDDSPWRTKFVNGGGNKVYFTCWLSGKNGGDASFIRTVGQSPIIAASLESGEELMVSFAENTTFACASFGSSLFTQWGQVDNTWYEGTFTKTYGTFDISRNINMNGDAVTAKGSKCTSDMNTCVFKCKDSNASTCGDFGTYDLYDIDSGCGGGADATQQGDTGGGCSMGADSETVTVTFGA